MRHYRLIAVFALMLFAVAASAQEETTDAFEAADCPFELAEGFVEGRDVDCGYVTVPEFHAQPDGATIRIAVAIFNSTASTPAADPLVMAQGGPGGSTLDAFGAQLPQLADILRQSRDVVLIEQRGTLYSEPSLTCPELTEFGIESLGDNLSVEESLALQDELLNTCRERLLDEGVNFNAFNSIENAADVPVIMDALGYTGEFNYYGVSYGALLAQHLLRDHPERVRAAVIDAVAPTNINFMTEVPITAQRVFDEMFTGCAASADCSAAYPDLEADFYGLIDELNADPVTVTIADPDLDGVTYEAILDGNDMISVIFASMYSVPMQMPGYIDSMTNGNFTWLEIIGGQLAIDRTSAPAMGFAILCAEDGLDYTAEDITNDGIDPRVFSATAPAWQAYPAQCEAFDVAQIGDFADETVATAIPVLALSGNFDPITPPSYADAAIVNMSNVYNYTFPHSGHGAIFTSDFCALSIMQSFLADPIQEPDVSCIDALAANFSVSVPNPAGTFTIPVPAGWVDNSNEMFNLFEDPETGSLIYAVATAAGEQPDTGIDEALAITQGEDFALNPVQSGEVVPGIFQSVYVDGTNVILVISLQNNDATQQANVVIVADQAGLPIIAPVLDPVLLGVQFTD